MLEYEWGRTPSPSQVLFPTTSTGDSSSASIEHHQTPSLPPYSGPHSFHDSPSFPSSCLYNLQQQAPNFHPELDPRGFPIESYPPGSLHPPHPSMMMASPSLDLDSAAGLLMIPKPEPVLVGAGGQAFYECHTNNFSHPAAAGIGLNLGLATGRTYFSAADEDFVSRLYRRPIGNAPRCQAEGCNADLTHAKHYHRRHKVCDFHSKASTVVAAGLTQRFCQQCSRFHLLTEFDNGKRSCRRRLADHNRRRRKSNQPQPSQHRRPSQYTATTSSPSSPVESMTVAVSPGTGTGTGTGRDGREETQQLL